MRLRRGTGLLRPQRVPDHHADAAGAGADRPAEPAAVLPAAGAAHPARLRRLPGGARRPPGRRADLAERLELAEPDDLHGQLLAILPRDDLPHLVPVGRGAFLPALAAL